MTYEINFPIELGNHFKRENGDFKKFYSFYVIQQMIPIFHIKEAERTAIKELSYSDAY